MVNKELVGGMIGTSMSAIGTSFQTNEILQTISIVITIIGGIITIVMALLNWWNKAKKDGKIDKEEIKEGIDIVVDGVKTLEDKMKDKEEDKK